MAVRNNKVRVNEVKTSPVYIIHQRVITQNTPIILTSLTLLIIEIVPQVLCNLVMVFSLEPVQAQRTSNTMVVVGMDRTSVIHRVY